MENLYTPLAWMKVACEQLVTYEQHSESIAA